MRRLTTYNYEQWAKVLFFTSNLKIENKSFSCRSQFNRFYRFYRSRLMALYVFVTLPVWIAFTKINIRHKIVYFICFVHQFKYVCVLSFSPPTIWRVSEHVHSAPEAIGQARWATHHCCIDRPILAARRSH